MPTPDRPVSRTLPIYIHGMCLPRPDPWDHYSNVFGLCKRVLQLPPPANAPPNRRLKRLFRLFVYRWVKKNLQPLPSDSDCSFKSWIESTNYPTSRREELARLDRRYDHVTLGSLTKYEARVESFIKDESYPEYKVPRWINSRSDLFKIRTGPIFKLIEKVVFKSPFFIKYVPVRDRPAYIKKVFEGCAGYFYATDYSSFESLFTPRLMRSCEKILYRHMTENLPDHAEFMEALRFLDQEYYDLRCGPLGAHLRGTRMSGEMCTSLGNGFMNCMVTLFTLWMYNVEDQRAVFEGDDGLFQSPIPINDTVPAALGLRIKIEEYRDLRYASFCGNVFDDADQIVVTDPVESLVDFGWTKKNDVESGDKRLNVLLRSKAYSLAYQYNGCPVLKDFAQYVLRVTRRSEHLIDKYVKVDRTLSEWERTQLLESVENIRSKKFVSLTPGVGTRVLVEEKYGLTVPMQIELERYFQSLNKLQPIDHPVLNRMQVLHSDWKHYFDNYTANRSRPMKNPADAIPLAVGNYGQLQVLAAGGQDLCDP